MATKQVQIGEIQKKGLEAAVQLAQLSIENTQRVIEIQVAVAKSIFEDTVSNAKALGNAKDPQEAVQIRSRLAQTTAEKVFAGAKEIAEVATKAQNQIGKLVGDQFTTNGTEVFEAFTQFFSGLPLADQNALNAFQGGLDSTRAAVEQLSKASAEAFQAFTQAKIPATTAPKPRKSS